MKDDDLFYLFLPVMVFLLVGVLAIAMVASVRCAMNENKQEQAILTTEQLTVKPGYWNGGVVNKPFVDGYFVTLFIPKSEIDFDREVHYEEIKLPTKELKQVDRH